MPYLTALCSKLLYLKQCLFKQHYSKMLWAIALMTSSHAIGNADLRVIVAGAAQSDAPFYFSLYDDPEAFEQRREGIRMAVVHAWSEWPSVAFTDLPFGKYVVAAFQDINGNGELDTNLIGQPTEPYALSGNAAGRMGPPRFDDAAIEINSDNKAIRVKLRK